jgi:hypothetical protein
MKAIKTQERSMETLINFSCSTLCLVFGLKVTFAC